MNDRFYCWREWGIDGSEIVSPIFATAREAGRWRSTSGQDRITLVALEQHHLTTEEFTDALVEYIPKKAEAA